MEVKSQDAPRHNIWPPGTDPDEVLPIRLRAARESAGLTQRQLAASMTTAGYGMHQTTIAKIEAGERPVTVGESAALARVLGVDHAGLITNPGASWNRRAELPGALAERVRLTEQVGKARMRYDAASDALDAAKGALRAVEMRIQELERK
jgi:transcriptional regulator with XRE-family HTH domain